MKNLLKLKVVILIFSIIFASQAVAADRILPIPKPTVDQETKKKTEKKKEIYPQKKPTKKTEKTPTEEIKITAEALEESKEGEIFIYPQKRPIVFQKKIDKAAIKSTILSSSDFKIAKASFNAVKKKKWQTAIKLSKKAKNKMVFKMVHWFYLIQPGNSASFYDYLTFINLEPSSILPSIRYISPSLIFPYSLKGSLPLNHFFITFGDTVFRYILCSARYLSLFILG